MNILFTYPSIFNPIKGGVERVTDTLCHAFLQKGHKIFYLNCNTKSLNSGFKNPVPTYVLPNRDLYSAENIEFYNKFLLQKKIDVIINQEGMFEYCRFFTNVKIKGILIISVIHNNPLLDYDYLWEDIITLRNNSFLEKIKRIARCCLYYKIKRQKWRNLVRAYASYKDNNSYIALLSPNFKESFFKVAPYLKNRTFAIPNPVPFFSKTTIVPLKKNKVIFVGRLYNKSKQVTKLLRIWKAIQYNTDWTLTIIGDGPDRKMLEDQAKKMHLVRYNFEGFVKPESYYRDAAIICMTSLFEGFPMVLVEAMQYGCVPIAFDSFAAVKDIIANNKNGFLVTPFNEEEYVTKLDRLIKDNVLRANFAIRCLEDVKKFSSENIAELWLKKIEQLKYRE